MKKSCFTPGTLKLMFLMIVIPMLGCVNDSQQIDLVNNDAHKRQAFNQILANPELQNEFFMELKDNREALNRMMQHKDFTSELFNSENMNYMWDQNPEIDTAVIDNLSTRMLTDTLLLNEFNRRMDRGTPSGTPR